jgi:hypothetical protein
LKGIDRLRCEAEVHLGGPAERLSLEKDRILSQCPGKPYRPFTGLQLLPMFSQEETEACKLCVELCKRGRRSITELLQGLPGACQAFVRRMAEGMDSGNSRDYMGFTV